MRETGQADHPNIGTRKLGSGEKRGQKEFGEEEVAYVIRSKLYFVAVLCDGCWYSHNPGIEEQEIEARLPDPLLLQLYKCMSGGLDGCKAHEIAVYVLDQGCRAGDFCLNIRNGILR